MKQPIAYLSLFCFLILTSVSLIKKDSGTILLLTKQNTFEVGSTIDLEFSYSSKNVFLYCSNSYGNTLLESKLEGNSIKFKIPKHFTNKLGVINWKLTNGNQSFSGFLNIISKRKISALETYIGPPSIEAGETDYTMQVVIPTDNLDNPIPDNTLVTLKHQFLDKIKTTGIYTKHLIAHKNIYSYEKNGRILISSSVNETNSKEFTVDVLAAIPTNFRILYSRPHSYADGNQITTFTTSIIKDKHNNIVSDGTYVLFLIKDQNGNILKTSGTTVKGVAKAKIIHPNKETKWNVKAIIEGMSESNLVELKYLQAVKNFEVSFAERTKTLTVGPIKSFMQQLIPDGLQVDLKVYNDEYLLHSDTKTSFSGFAAFQLESIILKKGNYKFVIETAGIEKKITKQLL